MPTVYIFLEINKIGKGANNTAVHKILNDILATYHAYMQPVYPLMDSSTVTFNSSAWM